MNLSDDDLKELFQLFTSISRHERRQMYDAESPHYYRKVDLHGEYELTAPKKEYAIDAWRAVLYFLYSRDYALVKDEEVLKLDFVEREFTD